MSGINRLAYFATMKNMAQNISKEGFMMTFRRMALTKQMTLGFGKRVGVDKFGNEYFEDKDQIPQRQRYVVPNLKHADSWDATDIPAEWHSWLSWSIKETPVENPPAIVPYKLVHQPQRLSQYGAEANYLPAGHHLNRIKDLPPPENPHVDPRFNIRKHYTAWRPQKAKVEADA